MIPIKSGIGKLEPGSVAQWKRAEFLGSVGSGTTGKVEVVGCRDGSAGKSAHCCSYRGLEIGSITWCLRTF